MRQESLSLGLLLLLLHSFGCDARSPRPAPPKSPDASWEAPVTQPTPPGQIRLAAIFPTSGRYEASGKESLRGVRMAVEAINREGGVDSRPLFLVEYATRSDVESTEAAARQAVSEGALAIIGSNASLLSEALAEVAEASGVVMVSNVSTATELTLDRPFVFRTCYSNDLVARLLARFVWLHLGGRRVAVLQEVSRPYSKDLGEAFERHFKTWIQTAGDPNGAIRVWQYVAMEVDFTPHLDAIRRFSPDVLFLPSSFDDATIVAMQVRAMGLDLTMVGGDSWSSERLFSWGDPGRPAYHSDHWDPNPTNPFYAAYRARYGTAPEGGRAPLAHDAVRAVAAALAGLAGTFGDAPPEGEALATARRRLRDALEKVRFEGATGPIRFDEEGNARKPCFVFKIDRGTRVLAATLQ